MDRLRGARAMAEALADAARVAAQWAGPQTAITLIREALVVLASEELEAELRATALPPEVAVALDRDARDVQTVLTAHVAKLGR